MKLAQAHIGNHGKNRVRFYIPLKRKKPHYFEHVQEVLKKSDKVRGIEANPVTGSVLIRYLGDFSKLVAYAKEQNLFEVAEGNKEQRAWVLKVFRELEQLDEKIKTSTDGEFDLASTAGMVFLGLAGVQIYRKQYLPAASALLLYAAQFLAISKNGNGRPKMRL